MNELEWVKSSFDKGKNLTIWKPFTFEVQDSLRNLRAIVLIIYIEIWDNNCGFKNYETIGYNSTIWEISSGVMIVLIGNVNVWFKSV